MRKLCEKRSLLHGIYGWLLRGFIMLLSYDRKSTLQKRWFRGQRRIIIFQFSFDQTPPKWYRNRIWWRASGVSGMNEHRICADSYIILNMDWSVRTFEHLLISIYVCAIYCSEKALSPHTHTYSQPPTSLVIKRSAIREWLLMPKMSRLNHGSLNVFIFSMTQQYMLRYRMASRYQLLDMNWKVESSNAVAQLVSEMNEKC